MNKLFKNRLKYYYKHREAVIILTVSFILLFFIANLTLNTIEYLTTKLN